MIRPARGFVLITPEPSDSQTESGLYLPESGQEKPMKGTVVAIGMDIQNPEVRHEVFEGKKGDKVIFKQWSGNSIKEDGIEYLIIKFEDILGIYE